MSFAIQFICYLSSFLNNTQCDIRTAVANVLDYAALVNPSKIIKKIKYHYLTHIEEDIQWFGPLIGVMTENYESYNSVFRACSVLSNHLSPSRDIAHQLSRQETAKHILSGGSWFSHSSNGWVEPGFGVQRLIEANPHLRRLHGWPGSSSDSPLIPGEHGFHCFLDARYITYRTYRAQSKSENSCWQMGV